VECTATVIREIVEPSLVAITGSRAIIVANSDAVLARIDRSELHPAIEVMKGSNDVLEFSAYQEGVDRLRSREHLPETVLFVNDRALSYGDKYGTVLDPPALEAVRAYRTICGSIESYHGVVTLRGALLSTWCRTNFLLISMEALAEIGSLISVDRAEFDSHVPLAFPGEAWSPVQWLGPEYAQRVLNWLTLPGNWYRAELLSEVNWSTIRLKLLAIINEHLFSVRARERGVALVGYKQLAQLKTLGVSPTLEWSIGQYVSSPFMGDDRERTPPFRLFQLAAVWAGVFGLDGAARSLMQRSLAHHGRDGDAFKGHHRAP